MGRKTKKQKLRAEEKLLEREVGLSATPPLEMPKYSYGIPTGLNKGQVKQATGKASVSESNFIIHDIKRISVLTFLAICAQVVLWYLVNEGKIELF